MQKKTNGRDATLDTSKDVAALDFVNVLSKIVDDLDKPVANIAAVVSRCKEMIDVHTPKVTVYKLQLDGFNGPCVYTDLDLVMKEVEALLTEPDSDTVITLTKTEMTPAEIEALPEWEGY